jgi:ankyrin repeat protein
MDRLLCFITIFLFIYFQRTITNIIKHVNNKINVEAKSYKRNSPLHNASEKGHIEVIKYLIEQCHANVEISKLKFTIS